MFTISILFSKTIRSVERKHIWFAYINVEKYNIFICMSCYCGHQFFFTMFNIDYGKRVLIKIQGGSNMTGTDLCVNKPHCAAAVRP